MPPDPVVARVPAGPVTAPIRELPPADRGAPARARIALASAHGVAKYYADRFEGRRTASRSVFRQSAMLAAHRDYPFGTVLRVTNLANGRAVEVRVVDRFPPATTERARRTVVDVSKRAAELLDFVRAGRVPVKVEVLEWGGGA